MAATLSTSPAQAQRRVTVTEQASPGPVAAVPLLRSATAVLDVRGRAQPRSTVQLAARCVLAVCTTTTTADGRGRWKTQLSVVVRRTASRVTVEAVYPSPAPASLGDSAEVRIAPPAPALPLSPAAEPAPELAMVGDSLAEGTAPYLPGLLPEFRVSTSSRVSRPLAEGLNLLNATPLPDEPGGRLVLAFSLFTNDHPLNAALLEQAVRDSVARIGDRGCVLWATIVRPAQQGASYAPVNALLERLGREPTLRDRLEIVPWARAVKRHPRWIRRPDRVHATPEGYRARARLYADAARRCLTA